VLTVFLGAIAGISLVVGGIGIMNIMLVSVTERTREIGLRKAVGARRSDILYQFLVETITLSILGGSIGILLGAGISELVNASGAIATQVSAESVVLAFGFSAAIGIFFGIYPANRAAGLRPIEALRYE
jgi:putative ABC transport system permease protein